MESDLQKIITLTKDLPLIIPPGPLEEYPKSGITYLINEDEKNEYIADNPYIIEYLLFNNKKELMPSVTNQQYLGKTGIRRQKHQQYEYLDIFFYDRVAYLLHFEIDEIELPAFKMFLDHYTYRRRNSDFFFWDLQEFKNLFSYLTHKMNESQVFSLHKRLCEFHTKQFPKEAIKHIFIKKE